MKHAICAIRLRNTNAVLTVCISLSYNAARIGFALAVGAMFASLWAGKGEKVANQSDLQTAFGGVFIGLMFPGIVNFVTVVPVQLQVLPLPLSPSLSLSLSLSLRRHAWVQQRWARERDQRGDTLTYPHTHSRPSGRWLTLGRDAALPSLQHAPLLSSTLSLSPAIQLEK
jgi:hypothetical protein